MSDAVRTAQSSQPAQFGLVHFLRARMVGWGFIALLAMIAFFSARLALSTQFKAPRTAVSVGQKHAPDFTAKHFTLWRNSLDGATQYQLSGDTIIHYRDDLSSNLIKPLITARTKSATSGELTTSITADNGLIRNDGELVLFTSHVNVARKSPNAALSTLQSDSLVLAPDVDYVITKSPVTVTQGRNQSVAQGGTSYSHADTVLQLTGNVHTTIGPK